MQNCIKVIFTLIILLSNNNLQSQENSAIYGSNIWVKSNIQTNSTDQPEDKGIVLMNFNNIPNFFKDKVEKKYQKIINKKSSLFVVYRSKTENEANLLSIERGAFKAVVSNKKMYCDKEVILEKGNPLTGSILSYLFNKNSWVGKKKGNLTFDEILYKDKESEDWIAELIYIPDVVNTKDKATIETYLSVKFGISLPEDKHYLNSKKDTIWNAKVNKGFSKRVTGIGRDDFFQLNQKQSKNSLNDGLTIGLDTIKVTNFDNKKVISDKSFLIWGDNGKNTLFETKNRDEEKRMQRVWKIQTMADNDNQYSTQIIIDKKIMNLEKEKTSVEKDFVWLAVDSISTSGFNFSNARYIKATLETEEKIVFNNTKWNTGKSYFFTLTKGPEKNKVPASNLEPFSNIINEGLYKIYPNPVNHNENFIIQFSLTEKSLVDVVITDMNGRIVKTKNLGNIKEYSFTENLHVSGTYLINISVNGVKGTSKIIIK